MLYRAKTLLSSERIISFISWMICCWLTHVASCRSGCGSPANGNPGFCGYANSNLYLIFVGADKFPVQTVEKNNLLRGMDSYIRLHRTDLLYSEWFKLNLFSIVSFWIDWYFCLVKFIPDFSLLQWALNLHFSSVICLWCAFIWSRFT